MNLDSYYDPPEDLPVHPVCEEAEALLEAAGVEQAVIDRIVQIIDSLAAQIDREWFLKPLANLANGHGTTSGP